MLQSLQSPLALLISASQSGLVSGPLLGCVGSSQPTSLSEPGPWIPAGLWASLDLFFICHCLIHLGPFTASIHAGCFKTGFKWTPQTHLFNFPFLYRAAPAEVSQCMNMMWLNLFFFLNMKQFWPKKTDLVCKGLKPHPPTCLGLLNNRGWWLMFTV